ncbi:MAG: helix-turn-helix domain-containing protein [Clostridia bacterium]|nr:helix-turn-helix domain-containing protein [Clostridia bacterium]
MEDYKQIIANNISQLRRSKGMTQAELAEKLNYTDKAISKWERGESIPDAVVLKHIADMFGVSVDYLFTKEHRSFFSKTDGGISRLRRRITNRKFIIAICVVLIWLIATLVFVILHATVPSAKNLLCFVFALPATFIIWLVLNSLWFKRKRNFLIISLLMWSSLLAICILLQMYSVPVWYILILGIPGQAIIYFWSRIHIPGRHKKTEYEEAEAVLESEPETENSSEPDDNL